MHINYISSSIVLIRIEIDQYQNMNEITYDERNKGESGGGQIIAYADNIVLVNKRKSIMETILKEIVTEGKRMSSKINENKTKTMRFGKQCQGGKVNVG
ncbi:uncharacterized protein LOC130442196 isoform X3 [Diorhabda sublineata]|nr:uncharacterized protein LOC130442196 isoform X3 [Diorhabda sublineata]